MVVGGARWVGGGRDEMPWLRGVPVSVSVGCLQLAAYPIGGQGHVHGDGEPSHFFYVCYQARPELELNRSPSEAKGRGS